MNYFVRSGAQCITLITLMLQVQVSAVQVSLSTHPTLILTRAHNAAFGNKENLLTQQLLHKDKQEWITLVKSAHKIVDSLSYNMLYFWQISAQRKSIKTVQSHMMRIERINNDLLNTLSIAYGTIAQALPDDKKTGGTSNLQDLNCQAIDMNFLENLVMPLLAQKQVAKDIQESIRQLPKTYNTKITQACLIVETLGLMLEVPSMLF